MTSPFDSSYCMRALAGEQPSCFSQWQLSMVCPKQSVIQHAFVPRVPPSLFLDVGAHDGRDAIAYASKGRHTVLSFEPSPAKIPAIRANIARAPRLAAQQITLVEAAVADTDGEALFAAAGGEADGLVLGGAQQGPQPAIAIARTPGGTRRSAVSAASRAEERLVTVNVTTLDRAVRERDRATGTIPPIALLKIDAQGHDVAALYGAARLLHRRRVFAVVMEVTPSLVPPQRGDGATVYAEAIEWLDTLGYACFQCADCRERLKTPLHGACRGMALPISGRGAARANFTALANLPKFYYRGTGPHGWWTDVVCAARAVSR